MKIFKYSVAAALIAISGQVMAEGMKIGVIDFRNIVANSTQSRAIGEKLKKEFKVREDQLIATEKSLKEKNEKLQRNSAVMSEAEKSKLEREVVSAQRDLQRLQYEFREDSSHRQREEMQVFIEKLQKEVEKIAVKEKYDLVIQNEAVPYASKQIDITDKVLKVLAAG